MVLHLLSNTVLRSNKIFWLKTWFGAGRIWISILPLALTSCDFRQLCFLGQPQNTVGRFNEMVNSGFSRVHRT